MIYQAETITVKRLENNIAEICFCAPNSVNKLDLATLEALDKATKKLQSEHNLQGLILTSNKDTFIVGADITEFLGLFAKPQEELDKWLQFANAIFNRIEDLNVPTVSAITGHALGGGCEAILSTDFRIADQTANIGLPETKLGIMPGFGGTVRLPRIIGADAALEIITIGTPQKATQLLKIGIIDAVVDNKLLHQSAINLIHDAINGKLNWKERRARKNSPLTLSKLEAMMSFTTSKDLVAQKAGPHYPAPMMAVKSIQTSAQYFRNEALDVERKNFIKLTQTEAATSLVNLFLNDQYIKSLAKKATKSTSKEVKRIGVLGAGIMGGGIAYQSASKGVPVMMKDITPSSLDLGLDEAAKLLNQRLSNNRINAKQLTQTLSSITPSLHYAGIEQSDIVVEAVIENPEIKTSVLCEVEEKVNEHTIITSNTSTIPINTLAKSLKRPEKFCGMHFFNPVHRMPLVEVIRGKDTSEETINQVVAYAVKMGKSPIIVNDCPGFFVNRVLFPYFHGFNLLIAHGADFAQVDSTMEDIFGWPMGPAYLLDVVGIDTAHHAQQVMADSFPNRMSKSKTNAIDFMFKQQRFGQKNGQGFYRYETDNRGQPKKIKDAQVPELLSSLAKESNKFSQQEIIERMMIPMINEVILCLEQGIISSPQEADMALIYGLGFPPFRGGICRYIDNLGIDNYIRSCQQYQHLGALYEIPKLLTEMAAAQKSFYSHQPITTV